VPAEVLSGEEEAALAYAGATAAVEVPRPTAVIDIGGGSTELIVGDRTGEVAGSVSLQLGCVRITERHLASDPPSAGELAAARALIEAQLDHAVEELAAGVSLSDAASLVAVAGTATTLGALHLGLDRYDEDRIHGARMPAAALAAMADRLTLMTAAERAELGPIQPGREDVIHGGALVLHAALTRAGLDEVVISEADSLDGLAASLAGTWHGVAGPWEPAEPEDDNPHARAVSRRCLSRSGCRWRRPGHAVSRRCLSPLPVPSFPALWSRLRSGVAWASPSRRSR
jgi:exopolyphosphatase / guanosine-5'-triphosphate,3'-diphosphate pyrophosphatase